MTPNLSSTLSLIPSWSGMKALLGALSDIAVVVTHMTPSPGSGLNALQPGGNAGALTESQFSTQGSDGVGLGVPPGVPPGVDVAVAVGVGDGPPTLRRS